MFQKPDPKQSFPKLEESIVEYWQQNQTFDKSLEKNKGKQEYVFYDGPPFATGLPHYGHILAGTLKDVIPRYQTMRGNYVPRNWGWDCHGLPIENLIEKDLELPDKKALLEFGIDNFNEACRASVLKYAKEWKKTVTRMGRWVDMENCYKTMDASFMESVWWVFKSLWDKGLIYEGNKNMLICPRCVTPLSNFESSLNYQDVDDHAIAVKMFLKPEFAKKLSGSDKPVAMLPWTTTPWTLPGNMGIYINKDVTYALVEGEEEFFVLAEKALERFYKKDEEPNVVKTFKGKDLIGYEYLPLFPYHPEEDYKKDHPNVYTVFDEEIVSEDDGTGVVHSAVTYGAEDDFEIATRRNMPFIHHVQMDGTFADYISEFAGKYWKDAEDDIAASLKKKNLVVRYESYRHSYPHCWRCDSPLMYNTMPAWFVNIDKIKKKMLKSNSETSWMPAHLRDGRFGNWLENARDWCISRNRYWGAPLPVWRSESGEVECLGSFADLRARVPERYTKITFVRHGQSEGNTIGLRQGLEPGTGLTSRGKKQVEEAAKAAAKIHKTEPFDLILHSPLLRTEETAQILSKKLKGVPLQPEELVREINFGDNEGKRDVEIKDFTAKRHALSPEEHYKQPCGKGGESHADVTKRALDFVQKIIKEHAGKSILVATHSDIIRLLVRELEGKSLDYLYENGHWPMGVPKEIYIDNETGRLVDLHKHFMDEITYKHPKTGEEMKRVEEVLDCWFESGSMPYAQAHYPFENKERFEATFPANFIAEGLDQTRGWFYTLMVLSSALFEKPAFQNVIVNGIVLAEDGRKMSKRLQNYPAPEKIMNEYGADAMRVYLMHSPVVKADDLRFSEKGVEEVVRQTFLPLWNAYSFLLTYANIDGWKPKGQLYFVRHGQTDVNKVNGLQGSTDAPLNDHGRDQIQALRQLTKDLPVDVIVSSDYIRAKETADIINADFDLEIEVSADLREQDFGEHESKAFSDFVEEADGAVNMAAYAARQKPPKGETLDKFEKRVLKALEAIEQKHAGKNVLVVGHAGVNHVLHKQQQEVKGWKEYFTDHFSWNKNGSMTHYYLTTDFKPSNKLDQWILSEINTLTKGMTEGLDHYDLAKGLDPLVRFIDSLTNWYIRRSRRRFWKSESDTDKAEAYQTLYIVLVEICKLLAPFAPFMTEAMYRNLTGLESVHLADWPEWHAERIDEALNHEVETTRQIVALGHAARAKAKVKVRQPLKTVEVALPPGSSPEGMAEQVEVIKEELNVKEVTFLDSVEGKAKVIVKPNGKLLGPKLGKAVQDVIREAKAGNYKLLSNGNYKVLDHELTPEEIEIAYQALDEGSGDIQVESDQGVVVLLHTQLTPELTREGYARDMVRAIQNLRKDVDLNVDDRIKVGLSTDFEEAQKAIAEFQDYISKETLSNEITAEKRSSDWEAVIELNGHGVVVSIEKV